MRRQLYAVSFAAILCSGAAHAAGTQQTQTDYQRMMNSANNSSSGAFGAPQADPDAIDSTGGNTAPNGNTPTAAAGTNTPVNNAANSPRAGNGYGSGYGYGTGATNSTTSGTVGLGAYNSSPYNNAPMAAGNGFGGGRGAQTPSFTGQ